MSNLFDKLKGGSSSARESVTGPSYPYVQYINGTQKLGMGPQWSRIGNNVTGLAGYVQILVEGGGKASATGQPLGNKFFLKTPGKCKAVKLPCGTDGCTKVMETTTDEDGNTNQTQMMTDRYMFVNNIPMGNIPGISSMSGGTNFTTFRGLIPGMLSNLNVLNPADLFAAFLMSSEPDCAAITMDTVDVENKKGRETNYVPVTEIKMLDPCLFPDRQNRYNGKTCNEAFTNINHESSTSEKLEKSKQVSLYQMITSGDPIVKFYYFMLAIFATFLLKRLVSKGSCKSK